jgi:hypothetical protein
MPGFNKHLVGGKVLAIVAHPYPSKNFTDFSLMLAPPDTQEGDLLCLLPDSHSFRYFFAAPNAERTDA